DRQCEGAPQSLEALDPDVLIEMQRGLVLGAACEAVRPERLPEAPVVVDLTVADQPAAAARAPQPLAAAFEIDGGQTTVTEPRIADLTLPRAVRPPVGQAVEHPPSEPRVERAVGGNNPRHVSSPVSQSARAHVTDTGAGALGPNIASSSS